MNKKKAKQIIDNFYDNCDYRIYDFLRALKINQPTIYKQLRRGLI